MSRPSYKELWLDERKDRDEQLQWIRDAVDGNAKFRNSEPPYSEEEELARQVMTMHTRIAGLEEKQRWRVVADGELPEVYRDEDGEFIPFLVCEGDGGNPFIAMYNGINWWAGIFVPDITHWMPLPELPIVYGKECEE